jgi:hypothetical protein
MNPELHRRFHAQREADVVRQARRHPLADVHPRVRRQTLGRLGRLLGRPETEPARTFSIARSGSDA